MSLLKNTVAITTLCIILSFKANASFYAGVGGGVTDGAIVEAGYKMNSFMSIRGRVGYLPSVNLKALAGGFETSCSSSPFGSIDKLDFSSNTVGIGA